MNDLSDLRDNSIAKKLSLHTLIPQLTSKTLRFYIGNHDTMVGTSQCFHFIKDLTEAVYNTGNRSLPIELMISPSVGYKGHGTLPPIFENGSQWLRALMIED